MSRFVHTMRGQSVAINYGTNPQGEVAGVWVELGDGGQAEGLTATEELAAWRLAMKHHQARIEATTSVEFVDDGAFHGQPWVVYVHENCDKTPVDWFATAGEAFAAQKRWAA